uniref:Uncharacterized protein n=1 Tax=Favella ehrenbergii TaxID=182087 RepID=A0A7S3I0U7_9SPIT|mmetsp:Transcript_24259/g.30073  ORF Transcript_24259/g.30073 Transcript_24259/m.30073 type:complete len:210 (+) Transcript_24259:995-1624(+)
MVGALRDSLIDELSNSLDLQLLSLGTLALFLLLGSFLLGSRTLSTTTTTSGSSGLVSKDARLSCKGCVRIASVSPAGHVLLGDTVRLRLHILDDGLVVRHEHLEQGRLARSLVQLLGSAHDFFDGESHVSLKLRRLDSLGLFGSLRVDDLWLTLVLGQLAPAEGLGREDGNVRDHVGRSVLGCRDETSQCFQCLRLELLIRSNHLLASL